MISVIYGSKGTGKTKAIIDMANKSVENSKGSVIYITDTREHMYDVKYQIRYIAAREYGIETLPGLIGFLKGIIAGDHDIEYMFIDGAYRIAHTDIEGLKELFELMEGFEDIRFTLTISSDFDNLPDFIKKYV